MSGELFWPFLCLTIGLILLVLEVFIPSGGLLGLLAAGMIVVGLWLAFAHSITLGLQCLVAIGVLVPIFIYGAIQIWPKTPMGRWMILKPPNEEDLELSPTITEGPRLEYLIGQYGRSLTPLRPSGMVEFDGRRLDALAEEGMIPSGVLVRAVQLRGSQVVVRTAPEQTINELFTDPQLT